MASGKRSVAVSAAGNFVAPLVGLFTAPMLASGLGATGRGELAAATAALMLGVNLATLGLPDVLIYYSARKGPGHRNFVLWTTAVLGLMGLLCSAGIFMLSGFLSDGNEALARLIGFSSLAIAPGLLLASLRGVASGFQAWDMVMYEKFINYGLRLAGITTAFLLDRLSVEVAAAIMAVTTFVGILAYVRLPKVSRAYQPSVSTEPEPKFAMSFGARVWIGSLTGVLLLRIDQALLIPLAGAYALGIYAVAVNISEMALLFNYAVAMVMKSREARSPDTETLAMATRISSAVTYVGCVAIALLSIWAVPFFFGDAFADVVPVVWILLVGVALGNSGSVAGAGLTGRGRPGMRSLSLAIALVVNVVSLLALAPVLGAAGAALATTIGNVISGGLNLLWFKLIYRVRVRTFLGLRSGDLRFLLRARQPRHGDRSGPEKVVSKE